MNKMLLFSKGHIGETPGAITGNQPYDKDKINIQVFDYNKDNVQELELSSVDEIIDFKETDEVSWININPISMASFMIKLGEKFKIHSLIMEDIVHLGQRPKYESMDEYLFITMKMLDYNSTKKEVVSEQISFILFEKCLITFQERPGDVFDPVRERIRQAKGRIRSKSADYLAYCLMDAIVDSYFLILEKIGDAIEEMEDAMMKDANPDYVKKIHILKRETIFLRKCVWPLREIVNYLTRGECSLIKPDTEIFIKDLYDHIIQVIDTVETFRDLASGLLDTYLTFIGNKMNEVMKVLTIIATIFIPLTFIAGIYGMNFEYMPELKWKWGYFAALAVMLMMSFAMVLFFKKKKWL